MFKCIFSGSSRDLSLTGEGVGVRPFLSEGAMMRAWGAG